MLTIHCYCDIEAWSKLINNWFCRPVTNCGPTFTRALISAYGMRTVDLVTSLQSVDWPERICLRAIARIGRQRSRHGVAYNMCSWLYTVTVNSVRGSTVERALGFLAPRGTRYRDPPRGVMMMTNSLYLVATCNTTTCPSSPLRLISWWTDWRLTGGRGISGAWLTLLFL